MPDLKSDKTFDAGDALRIVLCYRDWAMLVHPEMKMN